VLAFLQAASDVKGIKQAHVAFDRTCLSERITDRFRTAHALFNLSSTKFQLRWIRTELTVPTIKKQSDRLELVRLE